MVVNQKKAVVKNLSFSSMKRLRTERMSYWGNRYRFMNEMQSFCSSQFFAPTKGGGGSVSSLPHHLFTSRTPISSTTLRSSYFNFPASSFTQFLFFHFFPLNLSVLLASSFARFLFSFPSHLEMVFFYSLLFS